MLSLHRLARLARAFERTLDPIFAGVVRHGDQRPVMIEDVAEIVEEIECGTRGSDEIEATVVVVGNL